VLSVATVPGLASNRMEDTRMAEPQAPGEQIADVVPLRPADVSHEVELDDRPEPGPPALVEPAPVVELRPVIPAHLRTWPGLRSSVARSSGRQWHRARYHGIRSPRYLLLAAVWAVAGLLRLIGAQLRWWWAMEQHELRSLAAASGDSREWMRLHKEAKKPGRSAAWSWPSRRSQSSPLSSCWRGSATGTGGWSQRPWWCCCWPGSAGPPTGPSCRRLW